ncbi:MAG: dihydrodipicolinate synthase family protein [Gammaproteobacteria bacterium]|nr:dihydrodipicolinate synthase family protein [Gammaproteobacteria bacterium]MDH3447835.1 dihydrodipicolinate synthase family protein [Gammaproteobacteria bacterium]
MSDISGINLAMQTPMHADGSIDYARWEALIDLYIDAGVHGLVLGAGTGQHPYLTRQECDRLYELGAKRIDGRCSLICQTSALVQNEVIERSRHAQGVGADALMILPPYLEGPEDDDGLFAFYEAIDAAVATDIIGYNIPQTTGIGISVELFRRLNQLENFSYIKDSAGDLTTHQEYLATGYGVLNGCDPNTVFSFIAGAPGCIWGGANYMPRESVQLYELVGSGDISAAMRLWSRMIPSLLYIWRGNYIPKVKAASRLRGFDGGSVRVPLRDLTKEETRTLAASLEPLD